MVPRQPLRPEYRSRKLCRGETAPYIIPYPFECSMCAATGDATMLRLVRDAFRLTHVRTRNIEKDPPSNLPLMLRCDGRSLKGGGRQHVLRDHAGLGEEHHRGLCQNGGASRGDRGQQPHVFGRLPRHRHVYQGKRRPTRRCRHINHPSSLRRVRRGAFCFSALQGSEC